MIKKICTLLVLTALFSCKKEGQTNVPENQINDSITEVVVEDTAAVASTNIITKHIPKDCHQVYIDLLTNSKDYKETTKGLKEAIVANGGTGIQINLITSPDPSKHKSLKKGEVFTFAVSESYPDHTAAIATYIYDPVKKQLTKEDVVLAEFMPVPFDKKYIAEIEENCK